MKKRLLSVLLTVLMLCTLLPTSALAFTPEDFSNSSWFGQYTGDSSSDNVDRYIDFTINDCQESGSFTGTAKITTIAGQGHDHEWYNYDFKGNIDFDKNTFFMQGTNITSKNSGNKWNLLPYDADIQINDKGDMSLSGYFNSTGYSNKYEHPFFASRTSAWARDEMTEANILGLIPETLKGADMSKPITRAEFAAVAVELCEALTGSEAQAGTTPFTDISGDVNETAIAKAYDLGITNGVSRDKFAPNDEINREQLATMLTRAIKKYSFTGWTLENDDQYALDTTDVTAFADDADISDFARTSVYYMVKMGIINGVDDTHFAPQNTTPEQEAIGYATATREQAVALSLRIYKLLDSWK